jgi:hypothetical protein
LTRACTKIALWKISIVSKNSPAICGAKSRVPPAKNWADKRTRRARSTCRATLVGWNGEYRFGCAMDRHFFAETGIDSDAFRDFVATGAGDEEVAHSDSGAHADAAKMTRRKERVSAICRLPSIANVLRPTEPRAIVATAFA